jgi:hypothetical protein
MMAEHDKSRPPSSSRLLVAVGYLGLTPLLRLFRIRRDDEFLRHHQAQALAASVSLFLLLLIWPIYLTIETYLVRHHVGQTSHYHAAEAVITIIFLGGLSLWGLTSMVAIGMAIAGSTRPLPLVAWLARRPRLMRVALIGNSVLMTLVVLVVGLAIHASSLAREDAVPAPVYFLYDNQGFEFLGTWGPKLFSYRISRVAQERWGPGSMVVAPLSRANLGTAITHGRLVVLIGHGDAEGILTVDRMPPPGVGFYRVPPSLIPASMHGKDLQFVYLSECYSGNKAAEWERVFAPAEVVTFDRLSGPMEHLWWLWFDAPDRLKEIR